MLTKLKMITAQVEYCISEQIEFQVWDPIEDCVTAPVEGQVWDQGAYRIVTQVWRQVRDLIYSEL